MLESIWTVGEQVLILFILSGVGFVLGKAKMIGDKFSRDACPEAAWIDRIDDGSLSSESLFGVCLEGP